MPVTDPNERARRAVIRSIDNLTELVSIIRDDPGDQNPNPSAFQCEPDDLFGLTFSRVGISNDALISGFVAGLRTLLPEIRARIQELFDDLQPAVQIRLVFNVVRGELAKAQGGGGASKGAAKKASKKSSKKAGKGTG